MAVMITVQTSYQKTFNIYKQTLHTCLFCLKGLSFAPFATGNESIFTVTTLQINIYVYYLQGFEYTC